MLSRDRLLERVWGYDRLVETRSVDVHVGRLRGKLGTPAGRSKPWSASATASSTRIAAEASMPTHSKTTQSHAAPARPFISRAAGPAHQPPDHDSAPDPGRGVKHRGWGVFPAAAADAALMARAQAVSVQDRVIRLEMRLRLRLTSAARFQSRTSTKLTPQTADRDAFCERSGNA